jgi:hypothetical protein
MAIRQGPDMPGQRRSTLTSRGDAETAANAAPDVVESGKTKSGNMPKYRVFIAETELFAVDVAAEDEAEALTEGMTVFGNAYQNSIMHHSAAMFAAPLSDDAEVENED